VLHEKEALPHSWFVEVAQRGERKRVCRAQTFTRQLRSWPRAPKFIRHPNFFLIVVLLI